MKNNIRKMSCILLSLLMILSGCGPAASDPKSTTEVPIIKHDLCFDIEFDGNFFLDKYDLDLYINDKKIKSLSNGEDYAEKQTLPEGVYTVKIVSDEDPDIFLQNTVKLYTDVEFKCWLKTHEDYIECNDLSISGQDVVNKKTAESDAERSTQECTLTLNVNSFFNLIFSTYDINVFLDGEKLGKLQNGTKQTFTATKTEGEHTLRFESTDDANIFGECYIYFNGNAVADLSLDSHSDSIKIDGYVVNGAGHVIDSLTQELDDETAGSAEESTEK